MSACDTLAPRRAKVAPRKGFSHMDWITLNRKAKSMTSVGPGDAGAGEYTLSQVREHSSKYNAWMVLRGRVYDVTKYVPYHPGGAEQLLRGAGIDGTALFDQYHKWVNTDFLMKRCCVGVLVPEKAATAAVAGEEKVEGAGNAANSWTTLSLVERAELSATSIMLRFSADKNATASWGQCFSHFDIRRVAAGGGGSNRSGSVGGSGGSSSSGGGISGGSGTRAAMLPPALPNTGQRGDGARSVLSTSLSRAYTPVSVHAGTVILALRVYKTGQMSRHLAGLAVGDSVQAQCSNGGPDYLGGGKFSGMARSITDLGKGGTMADKAGKAGKAETSFKRIAMVAGGSGITPMFQLIQAVLQERLAESKAESKMGDASMYSPSAAVDDEEDDDEDDEDEDGGVDLMLLAVCRTSSDVMLFNELKAATVQFEGKLKVRRGQAWISVAHILWVVSKGGE